MKVCTIRAFDLAVQMQGYRRKTTISQRAFWSHVQQEVEIKAHVLMLLKLCSIKDVIMFVRLLTSCNQSVRSFIFRRKQPGKKGLTTRMGLQKRKEKINKIAFKYNLFTTTFSEQR